MPKKNIALINSLIDGDNIMEPIALTQISSVLLQHDVYVKIHSYKPIQSNIPRIYEKIIDQQAKFVGLSMWSHNAEFVLAVCQFIKKRNPDIVTIVGGYAAPKASKVPSEFVDHYVIGEGELPLLDIITENYKCTKHPSIIGPIEYDISQLPPPSRELVNYEHHPFLSELDDPKNLSKKHTYVFTYRGCPFSCSFCAIHEVYGKKIRKKSICSVMDELNHMYEFDGINTFINEEDVLFTDRSRVLEWCDAIISSSYDFIWTCSGTVRCMDEELLSALKEAGCKYVFIGSISGSDLTLHKSRVGFNTAHLKKALEAAFAAEMPISSSFLVGFPNDNLATLRETAAFIEEHRHLYWDVGVGIVRPFDGTPLSRNGRTAFGGGAVSAIACDEIDEEELERFIKTMADVVDFTF